MDGELTHEELEMLQFEELWWKRSGAKDTAIRKLFDCTPIAYYQRLNALIDRPEALAIAPLVVRRLQAQRAHRGWRLGHQDRAV